MNAFTTSTFDGSDLHETRWVGAVGIQDSIGS